MSLVRVTGLALRCDNCGAFGPASLKPEGDAGTWRPMSVSRYEAHRAGWTMQGVRDLCPEYVPAPKAKR